MQYCCDKMDINAVFTVVKQSEIFDVSAFGILYPLSQKEYAWQNCVIKGLVAVAVIEGLQPIFGRAFDMNDIILNSLGIVVSTTILTGAKKIIKR